ncbi:MAG: hypothetical protein JRI46_10885 [Deltaproteobacteria bacterium]|nr:hypothetical protein [Deltaproteobacteria bacterium]
MKRCRFVIIVGVVILLFGGMTFLGCATLSPEAGKTKEAITYEVCPSAEITKVDYFMKKYKGAPRLHFTVAIKNISKEPKRYRLQIFLPEGPSSGGFYPRKGKPPVIKPGQEHSRTFPMYFSGPPTGFTMVVKEL